MGPCRVATGWREGGGAALWPAQLSFLVSSRGLYLAAPQRCHCDLFKAMSSSRHDNMSLALQRHHRNAAAKKQIASIDPAPLQPPPHTPSCFSDANRQERGGLPWQRGCLLSDVNCLGLHSAGSCSCEWLTSGCWSWPDCVCVCVWKFQSGLVQRRSRQNKWRMKGFFLVLGFAKNVPTMFCNISFWIGY